MRTTPLLILAYNRPDKVQRLVDRLRTQAPQKLMIAVDGPKPGNDVDAVRVASVHEVIQTIDWTSDIETLLRPVNLGLRAAVTEAVSWAISAHGQAIVIEEDVLPGPDWTGYASCMLERFRQEDRIEHISGYNIVPPHAIGARGMNNRLSIYPESIAWATWERAWSKFDGSLDWALSASLADLERVTGSRLAALRWRQNFADAASGRISTWAYRWIASMWSRGALTLSPNHNLVTYAGYDVGTNSILRAPWKELPLFSGDPAVLLDPAVSHDKAADDWVNRTVFGGTAVGVAKGVAISAVLELRRRRRRSVRH